MIERVLASLLFLVLLTASARADWLEPGEPLTRERLQSMLFANLDIGTESSDRRMELQIRQPALPLPNRAQGRIQLNLVDISSNPDTGMFDATLAARLDSGEQSMIPVSGRIEELMPVVVPNRTIRRGESIDPNELSIDWRRPDGLGADVLFEIADAAGLEADRFLRRDQPIYEKDIRQVRLIRQGEIVEVRFMAPGLELAALAEALDDGARGDVVRLSNVDSGKQFRGIVTSRKVAVVSKSPIGSHP